MTNKKRTSIHVPDYCTLFLYLVLHIDLLRLIPGKYDIIKIISLSNVYIMLLIF
jgi:hypothetical protein